MERRNEGNKQRRKDRSKETIPNVTARTFGKIRTDHFRTAEQNIIMKASKCYTRIHILILVAGTSPPAYTTVHEFLLCGKKCPPFYYPIDSRRTAHTRATAGAIQVSFFCPFSILFWSLFTQKKSLGEGFELAKSTVVVAKFTTRPRGDEVNVALALVNTNDFYRRSLYALRNEESSLVSKKNEKHPRSLPSSFFPHCNSQINTTTTPFPTTPSVLRPTPPNWPPSIVVEDELSFTPAASASSSVVLRG